MHILSNGDRWSGFQITPANWESKKASLQTTWKIRYRYYPVHGTPIQVVRKLNKYPTVEERREAIRAMMKVLRDEMDRRCAPVLLFDALDHALSRLQCTPNSRKDIGTSLRAFKRSAIKLHLNKLLLKDFTRKHARVILEGCLSPTFTAISYNRARKNVSILLSALVAEEWTDHNPMKLVPKMKVLRKMRETLTLLEFVQIDTHLQKHNIHFWKFFRIFFHSGARITELLKVKKQDVFLDEQVFRVQVLKGSLSQQQYRVIMTDVIHIWKSVLDAAEFDDYLFSKHLQPGKEMINMEQINRRWKRHVKDKLNITADFYSLKHLHTQLVARQLDVKTASLHDGHTNIGTTKRFYLGAQLEQLKELRTPFHTNLIGAGTSSEVTPVVPKS